MLEFIIASHPVRRIICQNEATYIFIWPYLFSARVPGALPLCRWAARRGAAVHGSVRLQPSEDSQTSHRCFLSVTRSVAAGCALLSLPVALSISVDSSELCRGTFAGRYNPVERLSQRVARELHNPKSPHRKYLEFLHDLHNADTVEVQDALSAELRYNRVSTLAHQLDAMYGGNALRAHGAANAPFLAKGQITTARQRVEWVRLRQMQRRLEQSVPHFAAQSTSWALSMVLSRGMEDDAEGLSLYPLIDFCVHSFEPNAYVCVDSGDTAGSVRPVRWAASNGEPLVHVITRRALEAGEKITLRWHSHPLETQEDAEFWQLRFGYIPKGT